jgi:hypothetical protein
MGEVGFRPFVATVGGDPGSFTNGQLLIAELLLDRLRDGHERGQGVEFLVVLFNPCLQVRRGGTDQRIEGHVGIKRRGGLKGGLHRLAGLHAIIDKLADGRFAHAGAVLRKGVDVVSHRGSPCVVPPCRGRCFVSGFRLFYALSFTQLREGIIKVLVMHWQCLIA